MFIVPIAACILTGCATEIDTREFDRFVANPPKAIGRQWRKQNPGDPGPKPACYINGEFFTSCPR
jgi:hypothetical protein